MPQVHLVEGLVGAGKSTYAAVLARRMGMHIALADAIEIVAHRIEMISTDA